MGVIYKPSGRAKEYSKEACNVYRGCGHKCKACWGPSALRMDRETFYNNPVPRKGILEAIEEEAEELLPSDLESPILLCFTCDSYQPINDIFGITRKALEVFDRRKLPVQILTKGGLRAVEDFDILSRNKENLFAVTLTCDDPAQSLWWEPNAALPAERIKSLRIAHEAGISTWVSFEPVYDPEAIYRLIQETHKFVDLYKVGKLNYHPHAKKIDWAAFGKTASEMLRDLGKQFYIKEDLKKYMVNQD